MNLVFTPASILEILSQIDELKEYEIGITETLDGNLQIQVGSSIYEFVADQAEEVEAPEEVIDSIEEINEDAYEELVYSGEDFISVDQDTIESGLIKEAIKSMLLGGAIKFIKKLI